MHIKIHAKTIQRINFIYLQNCKSILTRCIQAMECIRFVLFSTKYVLNLQTCFFDIHQRFTQHRME